MNMSFGVQTAPPATGDVGGVDLPPAPSTAGVASTPLPPVPAPFSGSFTFQGPSGNVMPPLRPPSGFLFAGPRFTYPNAPASVPPASPMPPYSAQPGFTFQGAAGNPVGMATMQTNVVGQSPAVGARPFPPTGMAPSSQIGGPPPSQVGNTQGSQTNLPGSMATPETSSTHGSLMPTETGEASSATPPSSLQVPGTQVVPPSVAPSITGLPAQIQIPAISSPAGAVAAARPGLGFPTSTTLPYVPPRPAFTPTPVAGPATMPPGGMVPRFPSLPFAPLVRPGFPPRVGATLVRPPPGALIRPGALLRPDLSKAAGAYLLLEKPQTLVYVGKIASTVDDEFLRSILELCGSIKSWKRAQEPTTGTPKGFGFCEFELPDGVLRAMRLLNGFSLEGQELLITVNQTTKEYLERFLQKKKEKELQEKLEASQAAEAEDETAPGVEAPEPSRKPASDVENPDDTIEKLEADPKKFGIVNDEDKEKDDEAQKKLTSLLEERAKTMPLPPPPPLPSASDAPCKSNSVSDTPAKSREGDLLADGGKSGGLEGNNDEESIKNKGSSEHEKLDTGSSDQGRRLDHYRDRNRDRERERDRDVERGRDRVIRDRERGKEREKQEKEEREEEQSEREREKKRARREKDREMRIRHAERQFENREREWERDEKEKERRRNVDREKEKEREKLRKRLIKEQEEGTDDETRKKSKRRGDYDEHKRRQKEREDDEYDRLKEQEEIAEAKQRKLQEEYEEQVKKRLAEIAEKEAAANAAVKASLVAESDGTEEPEATSVCGSGYDGQGGAQVANGTDNEVSKHMDMSDGAGSVPVNMDIDEKRSSSPPQKKLGFGLIGSGKRAVVPSVFNQDDEEEAPKERSLRELVPIDYTAEEMRGISSLNTNTIMGATAPNLAAAADYAKSLSNFGHNSSRDEQDSDHDKGRRQGRSKDKERSTRDDNERYREREKDKHRQVEGNRETVTRFDAKQLIDAIPKTKEELFAYKIDWKIYDQHQLHERMKPWIQKKILEFLGEEEETLVEFIVSNTRKHTGAAEMLTLLTTILDDEAEMFVMKLWRMLIFEVKKIETGLSSKARG